MSNVTAVVIQDSLSKITGTRITTFEVTLHRFVLAELNTHRMFSRNGASSRAIPFERMVQYVRENMAEPVFWGKNQAGMVADVEIEHYNKGFVASVWRAAAEDAIKHATTLHKMKVHKQICNRLLEPFTMQKMLITATSFDNWFWLRKHKDAQPEIKLLAQKMFEAYNESTPVPLNPNEWHVPYVTRTVDEFGIMRYTDETGKNLTVEEAVQISASCAAQTSYRRNDPSLEKASDIFDRLINSVPVHASPTEHQATPFSYMHKDGKHMYENAVYSQTVFGSEGDFITSVGATDADTWYSGNFKDWAQYRQIIPNNVCHEFKE